MRDLFHAIRYVVRTGVNCQYLPNGLPPWTAVCQQGRRWLHAGVCEAISHDLGIAERILQEREAISSAAILDGQTLPPFLEVGMLPGLKLPLHSFTK